MKLTLAKAGHKVNWLYQWGHDYVRFKEYAKSEENIDNKFLCSVVITGFKASFIALIFFGIVGYISS